ncbi:hypothetical protein BDV97DRAFT_373812 [Delphinella strobiligena]|nr:hypothetical protein BDV97DRAFT_373812 [Delphinella strobiligena]
MKQSEHSWSPHHPTITFLGSRWLDKANITSVLKHTFGRRFSTIELMQMDVTSDESIKAGSRWTMPFRHDNSTTQGASLDAEVSSGRMSIRQGWKSAYVVNVTDAQIATYAFMPLLIKSNDGHIQFHGWNGDKLARMYVPSSRAGWQ